MERRICFSGDGNTRMVASVTTPRVPSEPMKRPLSDGPDACFGTPLVLTTSPSGRTASRPSTCSPIEPCLAAVYPTPSVEMAPPTVATGLLHGSWPSTRPASLRDCAALSRTTPGCRRAVRSALLMSRMEFIRCKFRTMQSCTGVAAPMTPVPPPYGTTGTECRCANRRTRETSAVLEGQTKTPAVASRRGAAEKARYTPRASPPNRSSRPVSVETAPGPTIRPRSETRLLFMCVGSGTSGSKRRALARDGHTRDPPLVRDAEGGQAASMHEQAQRLSLSTSPLGALGGVLYDHAEAMELVPDLVCQVVLPRLAKVRPNVD